MRKAATARSVFPSLVLPDSPPSDHPIESTLTSIFVCVGVGALVVAWRRGPVRHGEASAVCSAHSPGVIVYVGWRRTWERLHYLMGHSFRFSEVWLSSARPVGLVGTRDCRLPTLPANGSA